MLKDVEIEWQKLGKQGRHALVLFPDERVL